GIILVTGPTGSGKTSTLYTALNEINDAVRKIITIEDPIEYQLKGINQIQASLTGHLVFSTLHTNDAPGALTRLVDMGVEPYLVASSLEAVLAQRLVRVLCPHCKAIDVSAESKMYRKKLGIDPEATVYRAVGCRECRSTGYHGRRAIFEWMDSSSEIRSLILKNGSTDAIRDAACRAGMTTLAQDGRRLVE